MSFLSTHKLEAGYGDFRALFGIDFEVAEGEAVAIIGANGAGKSTLLKSISGLVRPPPGSIRFRGAPIAGLSAPAVVAAGIAMVPEGRRLFPSLSVEENLLVGAHTRRPGPWTVDRVLDLFPALAPRRTTPATLLSGGQQQMVAIGRALMSNPALLLCDEISLGLAPVVVKSIYEAIPGIRADGTTIILVEQDVGRALAVADRVYCLQEGRVSLHGRPASLTREQITAAYFGV
ncbi:MAG: ABC transporter ATP-binding protein [Rhodospirillales bacterium]|nr:ABC transporter ATP-binding protein [Rhodospirillales bacterium]